MCASSLPSPLRDSPVARVMAILGTSLSYRDAGGRNPSSRGLSRDLLAAHVELACLLEVSAPKPGNITPAPRLRRHDLRRHGALGARARPGVHAPARVRVRSVGQLIADGVQRDRTRSPGANTNLGIVLLFAPLVRAAATRPAGETLRERPSGCSSSSTSTTRRPRSRRSSRPSPGGLGDAPEHDVRSPARVTLREAMAAAADRDSIASEYATGYAIVFGTGLPLLADALRDGAPTLDAIVSLHLGLLADAPRHADRAQGRRSTRRGRSAPALARCSTGRVSLADFDAVAARRRPPAEPGDDRRPRRRDAARGAAVRGGAAVRVLVVAVSARMLAAAGGRRRLRGDRARPLRRRRPARGGAGSRRRPSNDALAALADGIEADAVVYGAGLENRPDLVARLADGRELLGTPAGAAGRGARPVGGGRRSARGRRAGSRRPGRAVELPRRRTTDRRWLRKPRRGGGGRGVRRWAGGRLRADRDPAAPCRRARRARRWRSPTGGEPSCSAVTEQLHRPRSFQWTGNVDAAATARRRAGRARRPAASGLRRGRRALRGARRVRGRRDLGRPRRLGARGQPASAGCARAVRPWHLRGARAGRSRSRACPSPARRRRRGVRR